MERRTFLTGAVVAAALPVARTASAKGIAIAEPRAEGLENPELLQAYDRFLTARVELTDAKEALEWIAAEWHHLWPLAPEELLECANAHLRGDPANAERDIVGNFLVRDTSDLTKRFSAGFRQENPRTCFSVITSQDAQRIAARWAASKPKGRTAHAEARNRAKHERFTLEYERKISLADKYEAETRSLRSVAGVDDAKRRIKNAEAAVKVFADEISVLPAFSQTGLVIKAKAIEGSGIFKLADGGHGIIADIARFIQSVLDMGARAV